MSQTENHSYTFDCVHLAPDEQIGSHQHSTWELSYVITGAGMRTIGDMTEPFSSGEVVLVPPGISHCWYFDNKVTDTEGKIENITLLLDNTFLNNCAALGSELSEYADRFKKNTSAVKFTKEKSGAIIGILKKMCGENAAERIASIIKLIILIGESGGMKVVGKSQKTDKEKERMKQIQTYVVCNAKRNITLDDVARHIGMNRTSFCIFFKRTTGQTFVTYLNEHRIRLACQLLRQKKMSVSEICYAVGFNDVPYFNRVFKRCNGVTPRKYK